uniref:Uncharacterized protein n=1 Tax=Rhizophora mucronata TaxID=61149 RepID=A0A2P2PZC1_RHIMU
MSCIRKTEPSVTTLLARHRA